jgi:ribosome maturation factor RimP
MRAPARRWCAMAKNSDLQNRLLTLTVPELEVLGLDVVELELLSGGNRLTLRYALERKAEPGTPAEARRVGIDEIARASRAVSRAIEAEEADRGEFLPGRYTIEVSSPGIFRQLRAPEHFQRFCGERVRIVAEVGDETREYHGQLVEADDAAVELEDETAGRVSVPLNRIRKANLDPVLDFGR